MRILWFLKKKSLNFWIEYGLSFLLQIYTNRNNFCVSWRLSFNQPHIILNYFSMKRVVCLLLKWKIFTKLFMVNFCLVGQILTFKRAVILIPAPHILCDAIRPKRLSFWLYCPAWVFNKEVINYGFWNQKKPLPFYLIHFQSFWKYIACMAKKRFRGIRCALRNRLSRLLLKVKKAINGLVLILTLTMMGNLYLWKKFGRHGLRASVMYS